MKKINIREKRGNLTFKQLWLRETFEKLRLDPRLDELSNKELQEYLLKKYESIDVPVGRLYNNATNENHVMRLDQFVNTYLNEPYILSGYGCFYRNQNDSVNISSAALANLGDMRKFNKNKMEAAEHGSDEYIYYRVLQLTYKILMNSYYGILGEKNSVFYNPFVQNSITKTGQVLITTAISAMEQFLSNNTPFEDTDDVLTFINNVISTPPTVDVINYIDEPVSREELFQYLINHRKDISKINEETIKAVVSKLNIENVNRVYYCSQLPELLKNSWFIEKMKHLLKYKYENTPEEAMKPDLEEFKNVVLGIVWYDWLYESRYRKAMNEKRKTVITIDTDSIFVHINKYIEQVEEALSIEPTDLEKKGTIVNIFINVTTAALKKLFYTLTTNMGLIDEAKPLINMKQESRKAPLYSNI